MRELFVTKDFRNDSLDVIAQANAIIDEYAGQGYALTLRQLYYQFVARDLIPNTQRSYKRLGSIINDARLAGLVSWEAIEDRTRNVNEWLHYDSPADAVQYARDTFAIDMWATQPHRVEVWIEKEALTGIISRTCMRWDVPYFACRGYVSQSEQWRAYRRSLEVPLVILHLGDHDPSGIDMTRDNYDRLAMVFGGDVRINRLALNMDQVDHYGPPPNPAKFTDSRFSGYVRRYGSESWELDALEPSVINEVIERNIKALIDREPWDKAKAEQREGRERLDRIIEGLQT